MNIAIDGPAGAGKSTIAKLVARAEEAVYVDTGAMYRAMGLKMLRAGIEAKDQEAVEKTVEEADITIRYVDGSQHVILDGEDVTAYLREEEVGNMASATSGYAKVRARLVALQQKMAREMSVVMDGRDIGTVVLPNAEVKIYLTASARTRAIRRFKQEQESAGAAVLSAEQAETEISRIEADIKERDERDMTREVSPLKQAEDAILLDTSDMTIEEVVQKILDLAKAARA